MLQYGELIAKKLNGAIPDRVKVFLRFPENWQQFAPAVFVVFNGYEIVDNACDVHIVDTHWVVYVVVKDAVAQRDLSAIDLRADDIVRNVFTALQGETLDNEQVSPVRFSDRVAVPDVGAAIGIYPIGFLIRTVIKKEA